MNEPTGSPKEPYENKANVEFSGLGYEISFQNGPVAEFGKNGTQIEDLLDVAITRLKYLNEEHQGGKFRCRENSVALTKLEEARMWLNERTNKRSVQGVEGKDKVHTS